MRRTILLSLGLLLLVAPFVLTDLVKADDFKTISAEVLKAKMDAGGEIFLLNPLSDIEFSEGHIPGSINVPLDTIMTTDKLPQDKRTQIIIYCLGAK